MLNKVNLTVLADSECVEAFSSKGWDAETEFCASGGGDEGDVGDTCQGDSGGPLVYRDSNWDPWYQVKSH